MPPKRASVASRGRSYVRRRSPSPLGVAVLALFAATLAVSAFFLSGSWGRPELILLARQLLPPPAFAQLEPLLQRHDRPRRGVLVTHRCDDHPAPYVCGTLGAPLDYTQPDDERNAYIPVITYPAGGGKTPAGEVRGHVVLNPGGPGVSGVWFAGVQSLAERIDRVLGHKYNIVGFDPRGTGAAYPHPQCFASDEAKTAYYAGLAAAGVPGRGGAETGAFLAHKQLLAATCAQSADAELLRFLGTPFVARDMQLLHRALGDAKLNYWGFSYGTVIGATYADMFPNDVAHIVLDGVIEMDDYYSGRWVTGLKDIDAELRHFFRECEEHKCALASGEATSGANDAANDATNAPNADGAQLMQQVLDWIDTLKTSPGFTVGGTVVDSFGRDAVTPPQVVDYASVMLTLFEELREPAKWPALAERLNLAMRGGDFSGLARPGGPGEESEEYYAIGCSDSLAEPRAFGAAEYAAHVAPLLADSPLFGDVFAPSGVMCSGVWPVRAAERWRGRFDAITSAPLLVIGNDFDPVTPGHCADDLAAGFPNAVSVRRAGYGHMSLSQGSRELDEVVRRYFVEDEVPPEGTYCEVDEPVFAQ